MCLIVQDNRTALMFAASNGNVDLVKVLMEKGADVNIQDKVRYIIMYLPRGGGGGGGSTYM